MKIYFCTTNEGKLNEARDILGIEVEGTPLEIEEIQSLDLNKIATHKAQQYFASLKKPVLVEDLGIIFTSLNGLPGAYIKDFLKALGPAGLCKILDPFDSREAIAHTVLAFADQNGEVHLFEGIAKGTIAPAPRGDRGFGWDPIFIPEGSEKTFAEMSQEEKNQISMRAIALKKFKSWLGNNPI